MERSSSIWRHPVNAICGLLQFDIFKDNRNLYCGGKLIKIIGKEDVVIAVVSLL